MQLLSTAATLYAYGTVPYAYACYYRTLPCIAIRAWIVPYVHK